MKYLIAFWIILGTATATPPPSRGNANRFCRHNDPPCDPGLVCNDESWEDGCGNTYVDHVCRMFENPDLGAQEP